MSILTGYLGRMNGWGDPKKLGEWAEEYAWLIEGVRPHVDRVEIDTRDYGAWFGVVLHKGKKSRGWVLEQTVMDPFTSSDIRRSVNERVPEGGRQAYIERMLLDLEELG